MGTTKPISVRFRAHTFNRYVVENAGKRDSSALCKCYATVFDK